MRVANDTATFRFCFRGHASKTESLQKLRAFLHEKEWLPDNSDYDSNLLEYHTENDGSCEVILKKVADTSMEELADLFFADIIKNNDIFHTVVLYNQHTDRLVQTYAGIYLNRQKIELSNIKPYDEVIILHRN